MDKKITVQCEPCLPVKTIPSVKMSVDQLLSSFYDSFLNLTATHPSSTGLNLTQYPLPPSLQSAISSYLNNTDISDIAESPRQVGGCNDAYSAFAFLSFLFALLTFIQNNQGRRKRSTSDKVTVCIYIGCP